MRQLLITYFDTKHDVSYFLGEIVRCDGMNIYIYRITPNYDEKIVLTLNVKNLISIIPTN